MTTTTLSHQDLDDIGDVRVLKRDGTISPFDPTKIEIAITKAFLAVDGEHSAGSSRLHHLTRELTAAVQAALARHASPQVPLHIEQIQDQVELALMRAGHHKTARAYVIYREEHARARAAEQGTQELLAEPEVNIVGPDGQPHPLDWGRLHATLSEAVTGIDDVDSGRVLDEFRRGLFDGMSDDDVSQGLVMAARTLVETEPNYSAVTARLLLSQIRAEVLTHITGEAQRPTQAELAQAYAGYFVDYLNHAVRLGMVDGRLTRFDLDRIGAAIVAERDFEFTYLGLQTLYDRYLLHEDGVRFELPQAFFMRVAMGLALEEDDPNARAIEFYTVLSRFDFMASTPTLFNSGTTRAQLSSCFLTTIADDLSSIFAGYHNNALLAKYSGGLGNDWSRVRGLGAKIRGTNGLSQGVVPFLKIANDTAVAVNQGGKRKGAACAYLETWHIDVEEFLELRKNTGDDRRRTHDMNTANWVPDEFLRRVEADAEWTLFSPDEVPDLHETYGAEFARRYRAYEEAADRGEIKVFRRIPAVMLWRRMLTLLFETGHPWITFKDPCNLRSPQQHAGVVHSSNLCTEITLNTSDDEVAVCNLGSINLARHVTADGLDQDRLEQTVRTAVRMLDNVIDLNFYTIPQARRSNLRHRPIGLGIMGYSDALFVQGLPVASPEATEFADRSMEVISYHALSASADLAAERGSYASFEGSLWSQGILPIDSLRLLAEARADGELTIDTTATCDWSRLRQRIRTVGIRNSNVLAIAPTATISNICGVGQSIEPLFRNLYVKANMSGDFTVLNQHLVRDLKQRGLWDEAMVAELKYFDGSLAQIDRIPDDLKAVYATAFEIDPAYLIEAAARRQKWIDQAQSLNLYVEAPNGRKLDELYRCAWRSGLKTTYYLRSQAATRVEKSTLRGTDGRLNAVAAVIDEPPAPASMCSLTDPDCEACQ